MFTLGNWICIIFVLLVALPAAIGIPNACYEYEKQKKKRALAISIPIALVVVGLIAGGIALYNTHTESGKRALKSWESEISGGMNRVVHVYDMEGDEIATYKGKFDIQENAQDGIVKVKFDVDGERHIIYGSTGTIVIDEIPAKEAEDADTRN